MAAKQNMMQAIMQAAVGAIISFKHVKKPVNTARSVTAMVRTGRLTLKQPTFDSKTEYKYTEL